MQAPDAAKELSATHRAQQKNRAHEIRLTRSAGLGKR
jgi:hypothetical protein